MDDINTWQSIQDHQRVVSAAPNSMGPSELEALHMDLKEREFRMFDRERKILAREGDMNKRQRLSDECTALLSVPMDVYTVD